METLQIVLSTPYFVQALGITGASGVFIGAALYNGDLRAVTKTILSVLLYALIVLVMNSFRINTFVTPEILALLEYDPTYAQAYLMGVISIFYFSGMLLGVFILKQRNMLE